MVSTFTPNIQLEEPARGDYVGTWDTPVNANMTLIDLVVGGNVAISLNNSPVVLASGQFQSKTITFNSTLTGNVTITFPTSFTKSYEIQNLCTGSSAFVITLATTAAGGQAICCPPGEIIEMINDGANIKYKNLDRVGRYWDYGGSSVPAWVSGCTVAPYLNCDASAFSSATFPQLATILGTTTLPDFRGRVPGFLNQGTGRITTAGGGVDGNTAYASGGAQTNTIAAGNLAELGVTDNHRHFAEASDQGYPSVVGAAGSFVSASPGAPNNLLLAAGAQALNVTITSLTASGSIRVNVGGANTPITNLPPMAVGGIRMIRAG